MDHIRCYVGGRFGPDFLFVSMFTRSRPVGNPSSPWPKPRCKEAGSVVGGNSLIAKKFGPGVGGLFLAFPAIFPACATLIEKHEKQKKQRAGFDGSKRAREAASLDASGAARGSVGLIIFGLLIWWLIPDHRAYVVLAGSAFA
jgi:hypothetical protein